MTQQESKPPLTRPDFAHTKAGESRSPGSNAGASSFPITNGEIITFCGICGAFDEAESYDLGGVRVLACEACRS